MSQNPASASSTRALSAILPQIASGHSYEAHQKARTFAARYIKSGQYDTAIEVLYESAREMLKAGQTGSGVDLTGMLLDVYEKADIGVDDVSRGRLTQLIALTGSSGQWRHTIINKAIAWSAKNGKCPAGDADLHHYIAQLLFKEGSLEESETHLLSSGSRDSARLLSDVYLSWSSTGGAPGLFGIRGILPYLLNGNIQAARTFITQFTSSIISLHPDLKSTHAAGASGVEGIVLTTDSVLNFAQLAVGTCQRAAGDKNKAIREAWVRLCGTYQAKGGVLAQPEVRQVLNEISQLYFGFPPPRQQGANPMASMLSSMLGGPPGGLAGALGGGPEKKRVLVPPAAGLD